MELEEFLKTYEHDEKNEYILVHLTNYMPENGMIYSCKGKGIEKERDTSIGKLKYKNCRDTVHFAVNGCVTDHGYRKLERFKICHINSYARNDKRKWR
jgi:hypothetical protein